jgi:thiopurine S-methyltransferase
LEILCGDFFALTAADVAQCTAVYDRAAMIALPPDMRARYVAHMAGLLAAGCRGLLVTLEYPQEQMPGPPFSVPEQEVRDRLMPSWHIEHLLREDVLEHNGRFAERGLSDLHESVYRLSHL